MTTDQLDDPVSCSALAGSLRRHAAALRAAVREVEAASQAAADGWPGRVSVQHRRTAGDLATRAWELAGAMDRAGLALATHAADLAQVRTDRAGLVANPALGDEERAEKVYQGVTPLVAEDIAEVVGFVASRPSHVDLDLIVVRPRDQVSGASGSRFNRK